MFVFFIAIAAFVIVSGTLFLRHFLNVRRRSQARWGELLSRLVPLNNVGIEMIANDLLNSNGEERKDGDAKSLSPAEIWRMLDGMDGLDRMYHNSQVFWISQPTRLSGIPMPSKSQKKYDGTRGRLAG